jgi:hypothetical protein
VTMDLVQVYLKIVFVFRTFVLTTIDQGGEDARRRGPHLDLRLHMLQ